MREIDLGKELMPCFEVGNSIFIFTLRGAFIVGQVPTRLALEQMTFQNQFN